MKKNLFQPLDYTVVGTIFQGQQYILVKAIDSPKPHISVMRFTAGRVVLEEVGDKSADMYFSVEVTPYGALVPHEERIVVGHRSSERAVDSTFFFEFSPQQLAELNGILVGDGAVAKFYAAIGRPVPEWLVSSVVNTRRVQRPGVLGTTVDRSIDSGAAAYHQLA
jgi:hypothetical protein